MKSPTSISLHNEPFLEKWARLFRFKQSDVLLSARLPFTKKLTLIDYGCGQDTLYYTYLSEVFPDQIQKIVYIGIDPLLQKQMTQDPHIQLVKSKFESARIKTQADVITMFAVLEHVDDPHLLIQSALNHLKPGGLLIITTPSPLAKPVLEFFSSVLGIISKREIDEHQRYPTRQSLLRIAQQLRLRATHTYFEFGLNNLLVITRD